MRTICNLNFFLGIVIFSTGCATNAAWHTGVYPVVPAKFDGAYVHEHKEFIISFQEFDCAGDTNETLFTKGWLSIPIAPLKLYCPTATPVISRSLYHQGPLPDALRRNSTEIPFYVGISHPENLEEISSGSQYVVGEASNGEPLIFLRFPGEKGEVSAIVWMEYKYWREMRSYLPTGALLPIAIAFDGVTAPVVIPFFIAEKASQLGKEPKGQPRIE